MKTLINECRFEHIRETYKTKDSVKVKASLKPLIEIISNSCFLDGKLRFHPLGFIYGELYEFENSETLRVHIWNSNSMIQSPIMDIHNHYYVVNSFVLRGSVYNNVYEMTDSLAPTHTQYSGSYKKDGIRILTSTGINKKINLKNQQIVLKNNLYTIEKDEIHSGGNADTGTTITIVFSEKPGNPTPLIFGPLKGEKQYTYYRRLVDQNLTELIKYEFKEIDKLDNNDHF